MTDQDNPKRNHKDNNKEDDQAYETFLQWWRRLEQLEQWRELAVRPKECHPNDRDLLLPEDDDLPALTQRCLDVRQQLNRHYLVAPKPSSMAPSIEEAALVAKPSQIPNAGLGLYYEPNNDDATPIPPNTTLCYYWGHVHTLSSARVLVSDRSYLMWLYDDLLVDAKPVPAVKARYLNDPLVDEMYNCRLTPLKGKVLPPCAAIVSTREIQPHEELFLSYGNAYWAAVSSYEPRRRWNGGKPKPCAKEDDNDNDNDEA